MITEDYVSFETAKLLKEKGFYGECFSMYLTPKPHSGMGDPNEAKIAPHGRDSYYYEGYRYQCEAPTIQMAIKWLTEAYNIFISPQIEVSRNEEETGIHQYGQPGYYVIITYVLNGNILPYQGSLYPTPEEACETAIKYCLENLILKL